MTTSSRQDGEVFAGARRIELLEERDAEREAVEVGPVETAAHAQVAGGGPAPVVDGQPPPGKVDPYAGTAAPVLGDPVDRVALARAELIRPGSTQEVLASWGARGAVVRGSGRLVRLRPGPAEQAHLDAERTIRQATWSRSVNVLVANKTGGVGKTVTSVVLAGVLASVRGGSVAAFEVSDATGALEKRGEGAPPRGLGELVGSVAAVTSSGTLAGFTAPQTSHADVIGSVADRPVLRDSDVRGVREVLDRYYRVTVADSGNNPHSEAFGAAVAGADVLVVPTLLSSVSVLDALDVLRIVSGLGEHGRALAASAVVLVNHDGRPQDAQLARRARRQLVLAAQEPYPGMRIVEVPFDAHLARGGEITLAAVSTDSHRAWTQVGAQVVGQLLANVQ